MVDRCSFCDGTENGEVLEPLEVLAWNLQKIEETKQPKTLEDLVEFVRRFANCNLLRTGDGNDNVMLVTYEAIPARGYVSFTTVEYDIHQVRVKVDADTGLILESCDSLMCIFTYTEYAKWLLCNDQDPGEPVQSFPDPTPWV